ncbi:MAG: RimK/LysX family protein [Candidatus Saccharimonas sp.]
MTTGQKIIIGRTSVAGFPADKITDVPVKIDTGADSSSLWASSISVDGDGALHFVLLDKQSKHYTGKEHMTKKYEARRIRSSNGQAEIRYVVKLSIKLEGRIVLGTFTLSDRSLNTYPILIGCRLLKNKFLVDVAKGKVLPSVHSGMINLSEELQKDPLGFHEKYYLQDEQRSTDL